MPTQSQIRQLQNPSKTTDIYPLTVEEAVFDDDGVQLPSKLNSVQEQLNDHTGVLGAKNLLPNNAISQTINGVTFTVNSDGSVTVNGTATARIQRNYASYTDTHGLDYLIGKEVILNGCPSGGANTTYRLNAWFYDGANHLNYNDVGEGVKFTFPDIKNTYAQWNIKLDIFGDTTISNLIFKPMFRLASDPDPTYVPYAMTNRVLTEKVADLKTIAANASDFAAFKTAIANL